MKVYNLLAAIGIATAIANVANTGPALSDGGKIVIGMATAQSGFMVAYDGDAANFVKLWIEEQNKRGGILGKQIETVEADTKSDRAQGARAGQEVIDKGAKLVVVSCDYDFGAPAASAAQRAGLISMFLCAEDPKAGIQGAGAYAFTSSIASQVEGATIVGWAHKNLGVNKVYSLLDTSIEYDKSVCAGSDWAVRRIQGMELLGADSFKNDDASVQTQITRINNLPTKPDALMLCSYPPGGASALRQIRAAGLNMPILAPAAMDGTYWVDAIPGLSDFYLPVQGSVHGDDPRPAVNQLVEKYKVKFGKPPATQFALPATSFMDLWARAVQKAGSTDAAKVVPIMEQYKDEPTDLGSRTFSSTWHIQTDALLQILKYTDGKPKVVGDFRIDAPLPTEVLFRTK